MIVDNIQREKKIDSLKARNSNLKCKNDLLSNKVKLEKEKRLSQEKDNDFMNYKLKKTYNVVFDIINTLENIQDEISDDEENQAYYVGKIKEWFEEIEDNIPKFFYEYKAKGIDGKEN